MTDMQKERKVIDRIIETLEVSNGDAQAILEAFEMHHDIDWSESVETIVKKVCQ